MFKVGDIVKYKTPNEERKAYFIILNYYQYKHFYVTFTIYNNCKKYIGSIQEMQFITTDNFERIY